MSDAPDAASMEDQTAGAGGAARKKATPRQRAAAAAAAAASAEPAAAARPASPASRKRKAASADSSSTGNGADKADGSSASAPSRAPSDPHTAASRIQAFVRGARARSAHKQGILWEAWNQLDKKEEAELMSSHGAYEALKKAVSDKKKEEDEEEKAAAPSPAKKKTKGGKRASMSGDEAEAAMGLLLRDKDPLTFTWVTTMMDQIKINKVMPASIVLKIIKRVTPILRELPNIVPVNVNGRVTVVGDLHGQLDDLLAIFKLQGLPNGRNRMIFNGDVVDRGQHSCECVLALLAWKVLMPNDVHIARGNHEARDINGRDGFERECLQKYGRDGVAVFDAFSACFACLPLVHIIEQQVFVIHGGLFQKSTTLEQIAKINRFHEVPPSGSLMEQGLWSDPKPTKGREESPRGAGLLFGPDVTKKFFEVNPPLNLIVRSHECMTKGFKLHHHDSVITVFSASNYTGTVGNDGALIVFERDGGTVLGTAPKPHAAGGRPSSPAMGGASSRSHSPAMGAAASSLAVPASAAPLPHRSPRIAHKIELQLAAPAATQGIVPLKRSIVPFYASKKEKSAAYRAGTGNLETDIVAKILHLISDHRLSLIDYWSSRAVQHTSGVWTVTRAIWAAGLKHCLGLSIPFLEFQELLGVPNLGVDGQKKGPIDFMAFLVRFRPVNLLVLKAQRQKAIAASQSQDGMISQELDSDMLGLPSPSPDDLTSPLPDDETVASLQTILELLHQKRFELESLFRYLDVDGDEMISHAEFREGVKSLQTQLGTKFSKKQIDSLLHYIDSDGDGTISYAEFFQSFQLSDPKFSQTLERSKSFHAPETIPEEGAGAGAGEGEGNAEEGEDAEVAAANSSAAAAAASSVSAVASDHDLRSLSPRHSRDDSPPRSLSLHSLNDGADHDATSSSHMHRSHSKPQQQAADAMSEAEREAEEASTASEGEGDEHGAKKQRI